MAWAGRLACGAAALVVSSIVAGSALAGGPSAPPPAPKKWLPWYESGGFLSTEQHRSESNLFAPLWQSSVALLFFQASGKLFEDDIQEGNFDLGFRKMHSSGWNLGVWAGYDVRDTEIDNVFSQISFGFEALSDRWDVRANGYVAVSDPKNSPETARVFLSGNTILMTGGEEVPLSGFDGEVGYKVFGRRGGHGGGLKDGPAPHGRSHELRVYAGGFYFDDDDAREEIAGPRARVEWRIDDVVRWLPGSRLTFEGEFQYDDVREDQWEGGVRFRVPFGGGGKDARATVLASLTPQERRMTESIVRDTDIVTAESGEEGVFDSLTGVNFDRVGFVNGGGDLQGTLNANGPNSLVILNGGVTNGSFTVGPSQTLQGGGSTINVTGQRSGTTAGFTAPGSKPFIVQALNQAIVTVESNTHLAGLGIQGGGAGGDNVGILAAADGVSNVAITDTMIMDTGDEGILFGNNHNKVLIYHTSISNTGGEGIEFVNNNSNVTIGHTTINNTGNEGIDLDNNNSNVLITDTTITNVNSEAIDLDDNNTNVLIENVTIVANNAGNDGIDFNSNNTNITIRNSTVSNAGSDGFEFDNNNSNVVIQNVTVNNSGDNGIEFDDGNSNITISNVTVNATTTDAIFFSDNNSNVTISQVTINTTGDDGIHLGISNSNIAISDTTISNVGNNGAFINDGNSVSFTRTTINTAVNAGVFMDEGNSVSFTDTTMSNLGNDGVFMDDGNSVSFTRTTINTAADDGVFMDDNNTVSFNGTTISNVGNNGIFMDAGNTVTLFDTTISNAGTDGLFLGANNSVTMNISTFAGTFGDDVIDINAAGNTLAGSGNLFNGTFGDQFCEVTGAQNGAFLFGGGATCP